ncbi:PTS transporter subunit EIIB [Actinomyces mediterranea]|uniref:PTS transporter subunit EIIB n=1 Tax=Actinomyces mediterranea TaxID=1871028 RepID=UPI001967BEF5|nr:PTS transporter subunit EIIB [Actinomyces mediterranea]
MAVDYDELADEIVGGVGGTDNIRSVTHCATRLRMILRDEDKVDVDAVNAADGVITVVKAGGQFQVVIGDNVPLVFRTGESDSRRRHRRRYRR